jgi:hypothetical protein
MYARTIVVPLLSAIAACAPHSVIQVPTPIPALLTTTVSAALLDSNDPNPGRLCLVGTKDCMSMSEVPFRTCLLSTGRCKADGRIQNADSRLLLEPPVTGGANSEIILGRAQ